MTMLVKSKLKSANDDDEEDDDEQDGPLSVRNFFAVVLDPAGNSNRMFVSRFLSGCVLYMLAGTICHQWRHDASFRINYIVFDCCRC